MQARTADDRDESARQAGASRDGTACLKEAILRIGTMLDLDTVLREIVKSAYALEAG